MLQPFPGTNALWNLSRAVFGDVDFRSLLKRAAWRFQADFLREWIAGLARDGAHRALFKGFQLFVISAQRLKAIRRAPAKIARCGLWMVQSRCKQAGLSCLHVR
jgi:hypothetical protein